MFSDVNISQGAPGIERINLRVDSQSGVSRSLSAAGVLALSPALFELSAIVRCNTANACAAFGTMPPGISVPFQTMEIALPDFVVATSPNGSVRMEALGDVRIEILGITGSRGSAGTR